MQRPPERIRVESDAGTRSTPAGYVPTGEFVKRGAAYLAVCVCACGVRGLVPRRRDGTLRSSACRRCVMRRVRTARPKHGYATRPSADNPYRAWQSMIARCTNPRNPSYSRYGGRGIAVCDRWQRFENFIADMGLRPFPGATLERNNNDGNYEPGNVVWATRKQQSRNTCATVYLTHDGITLSLAGWAERIGLSKSTLRSRLAMQWPLARALMEPLHKGKSA